MPTHLLRHTPVRAMRVSSRGDLDCNNDGFWDVSGSQSAMLKGIQHVPMTV